MGFTESSYSSSEAEAVEVCVAVLSGELGTDITLHLVALSGTALGEAEVLYIYIHCSLVSRLSLSLSCDDSID